jgi:uncharacterized protein YjbJ (UPF0337 family)
MGDISDKMSGQMKETMGKMTDNKQQEWEGKALKARGESKDRVEDATNKHRSMGDKINL